MARFDRNRTIERDLAREPRLAAVTLAQAELVARGAEALATGKGAPWMRRSPRLIRTIRSPGGGIIVSNTDYAAHLQEWGSRNNPPHAPLRRAARAVGLHLAELP